MWKITTILLLALALRLYGINWDLGFHLHPDERMLIMVADRIHFFTNLNPDFFNYGSLPIYILKGVAQLLDALTGSMFANYNGLLLLGRLLSVFADLTVVFLLYKISSLFLKSPVSTLFAPFLYAVAFFPIQNSHFFVVDVFLNLFITTLLYLILLYIQHPTPKKIVGIGAVFGAALATKITAIIFFPILMIVFLFTSKRNIKKLFLTTVYWLLATLASHMLFMPYAYLSYERFIGDIMQQIKMNSDPYIFPYTLQYVGTLPYLYYLKNILFWGWGPIASILSLIGLIAIIINSKVKIQRSKLQLKNQNFSLATSYLLLATILFYGFYFLVIGRSAVKFMRYMLPLYPFLALLAGYGLNTIMSFLRRSKIPLRGQESRTGSRYFRSSEEGRIKSGMTTITICALLLTTILWTLLLISIYSRTHTRIEATNWILKNIPYGSTIMVEHWDDRLPLIGNERYDIQELTLYDLPDDANKWLLLHQKIEYSDYIIIASNRLYVPLQKLADCRKYKICYPVTAKYYDDLFSGILGFTKVAEFSSYPGLKISNLKFQITDDAADESFTVYDHPKIMIFKKI